MVQWCIGSQEDTPRIDAYLEAPVEWTRQSRMEWAVCDMDGTRTEGAYTMARAVAKLISAHYEPWVTRILRQQYSYLTQEERRIILSRVVQNLRTEDPEAAQARVDAIAARLTAYFWTHDVLVIEGAEDFLLHDVRAGLIDVVGHIVDEYFAEHEYRQFIGFLKDYVSQQAPHADVVHVRCCGKHVHIADAQGTDVGREIIDALAEDLDDSEETRQELLVSALVLLAPARVVLDSTLPSNLQEMLRAIFDDRIQSVETKLHPASSAKRPARADS
ncbi:MAG: sporulation protein YtxC [Sulfobacillus thermotolerans]|uniref:Uncharacterized protein n=1 Tax=Sulfobacillus thermotolerans TaxID=338644 RepID=A0ABM6RS65_9FIRM|nr:hypothetical protein BXT84_10120 [Sulfobacillus thermotolerans]MCY0907809.1 sporulation protein YtxC [Sulfobacillus thermotolerans]